MVNLWLRQATTTVFSFTFERTKQIIVRVTELSKNNLVFSLKCGNKWQRTLGRQLLNFNLDRAPPFYVTCDNTAIKCLFCVTASNGTRPLVHQCCTLWGEENKQEIGGGKKIKVHKEQRQIKLTVRFANQYFTNYFYSHNVTSLLVWISVWVTYINLKAYSSDLTSKQLSK